MTVALRKPIARILSDADLAGWDRIPTTIISDELNREAGMEARIAPVSAAVRFVGEALTVTVMTGDNLALHVVANSAPRGTVLIVNAGQCSRTAVWGEILHAAAASQGVAAVIIDGVIRDRAALRQSSVPVFACGSTPNGPHKGWGGTINAPTQCGGVSVSPGDLIVGDDDGIAVIPRGRLPGLLDRCRERLQAETTLLERVRAGESSVKLLGLNVSIVDERDA